METAAFPQNIGDIAAWRKQNETTAEEAKRRFVQFVILASISSSASMTSQVAFKGGNALRFAYGNQRSTLDLDFTANVSLPDDPEEIKSLLNLAIKKTDQQFQVKTRCQSIQRKPPGQQKTRPTYVGRICYQFPGDKYYHNFAERKAFHDVVEVEISLNDLVCETKLVELAKSTAPLMICTLEDILAEKLRALLQQVIRNRSRPQDVYDIAAMIELHESVLSFEKIGRFFLKKCLVREITASKQMFDGRVRSQAEAGYETEIRHQTKNFISFEQAWDAVLQVVSRLDVPEA